MVVMDDADLGLAVEGALFGGFGTAGQRCTSLGTAIVHATCTTSSCAGSTSACAAPRSATRCRTCSTARCSPSASRTRFEEWLGLIEDHHTPHGSTAQGRITADAPREGFVGDPEAGVYCHPTFVTGVTEDDAIYRTETFGPLVGVARFEHVRRSDRAGQRPRLRAVLGDLHDVADARLPLPRADQRGHGVDQQLHVGRRGAPAVRRQRQVGQRLAPVGHLGARPVHALAVDELGLRRQAPEGPDGHHGDRGDHRLPAGGAGVLGLRGAAGLGGSARWRWTSRSHRSCATCSPASAPTSRRMRCPPRRTSPTRRTCSRAGTSSSGCATGRASAASTRRTCRRHGAAWGSARSGWR